MKQFGLLVVKKNIVLTLITLTVVLTMKSIIFSYKVCCKQSTSSIKSLRLKTSNHKSVHTSFIKFNPSCKCLSAQPKGLIFAFTTIIIIIIFLLLLLFLRLILLLLLSSLLILINISLSIVFDIS